MAYTIQEILNDVYDATSNGLKIAGTISGDLTITGDLTVRGDFDFGDAGTDVLTVAGYIQGSASGNTSVNIGTGTPVSVGSNTDDLYVTSNMEVAGIFYTIKQTGVAPGSVRNIVAGTGIATSNVRRLLLVRGSGGNVTITATPSIAAGTNGEFMTIVGWDDSQTVTFQDEGTLAGSDLQLNGGVSCTLGENDTLDLIYLQAKGAWVERARSNN